MLSKKAIITTGFYVCFALCLCVGTEWYFRAKGYHAELSESEYQAQCPDFDKEKGWCYASSNSIYTVPSPETDANGHHAVITRWPDGSRASYPAVRRPTDNHVLVLGCSYAMGQGVQDHETLAWYLNEYFPDYTFENYANDAYGTYQCYLQEKQQLERHKQGYYSLVIYCPITHHLERNLAYILSSLRTNWDAMPHDAPRQQQQIFKAQFAQIWLCPSVYLKSDHTLGYLPALKQWPGDRYSVVINLAKHLSYFRSTCLIAKRLDDQDKSLIQESREIYWLLLKEMNQCAIQHGSMFATMCLSDSNSLFIELKPIKPVGFPYFFATDGTEGEPNSPKYRVGGKIHQHPNALVHKNWANHIREILNQYQPIYPKPSNRDSSDIFQPQSKAAEP